nr:conjugative transposon protein TraM [uncultured Pedobacter sp.]
MKTIIKEKRGRLLMLPLLVLPFLAMAFYALGGGRGNYSNQTSTINAGINTDLPDASFKEEEPKDKMGFYRRAVKDSSGDSGNGLKEMAAKLGFGSADTDPQTRQINQKLEAINREMNRPTPQPEHFGSSSRKDPSGMKNDVDRLEALMQTMQENKNMDSEMEQLNGLMQGILDLQYPERVQQREEQYRYLYPDSQFRAISAVIADNQKAVQGASVRLKLRDTIWLSGQLIPKGHDLFGTCRITNQRLLIDIKNIRLGTSIIPVDLSVYSLDAMPGINAPEAELTGAVNSGTDNAVRGVDIMGLDNSLATQVAGAGLDAAKSFISKRVRKIKVKLKAGYQVLLRNNQQRIQQW